MRKGRREVVKDEGWLKLHELAEVWMKNTRIDTARVLDVERRRVRSLA
jgi:hypothetical protein